MKKIPDIRKLLVMQENIHINYVVKIFEYKLYAIFIVSYFTVEC